MIKNIAQIGLRIPEELREQIEHSAKKSGRSMNGEMVARLAASFDAAIDLKKATTGEIVRELLDRNEPGKISIEISGQIVKGKIK